MSSFPHLAALCSGVHPPGSFLYSSLLPLFRMHSLTRLMSPLPGCQPRVSAYTARSPRSETHLRRQLRSACLPFLMRGSVFLDWCPAASSTHCSPPCKLRSDFKAPPCPFLGIPVSPAETFGPLLNHMYLHTLLSLPSSKKERR